MPASQPSIDLLRLFDRVLSGQASSDEVQQLEQMLDNSQDVRTQFAAVAELDVDLRHVFRTGAVRSEVSPIALGRASTTGNVRSGPRLLAWSLALAAAVLLVASASLYWRADEGQVNGGPVAAVVAEPAILGSRPPAPVATLASESAANWEGWSPGVGKTFREGDSLTLVSGKARISVGYGAEIAAEGPCALTFVARDKVKLERGKVAVHVAEWAKGFTVLTDAMEVVDLGTTFTVSADEEAGSQTSVLSGLVRVHPKVAEESGRSGVLVKEGGSFGVDKLGRSGTLQQNVAELLDVAELRNMVPYKPIQLHNSGEGLAEGDEDPYWQVLADPTSDADRSGYALVCEPDERYLPNEPSQSQWISKADWRTTPPNSQYTFRTEFDLDGYDLSTIRFFGRFLADNGVQEVRVNGKPVKVESWIDNASYQEFDHSQFRFVNVTEGLVAGTNGIEIDVWNGTFQVPAEWQGDPNPMALRVEWYAFGRQAISGQEISLE